MKVTTSLTASACLEAMYSELILLLCQCRDLVGLPTCFLTSLAVVDEGPQLHLCFSVYISGCVCVISVVELWLNLPAILLTSLSSGPW